jgi:hypothetical protein
MRRHCLFLFFSCSAAFADTETFTARCTKLAEDAKIQVVFEDRVVSRNGHRSISELRLASQTDANRNHSVLGITRAQLSSKWSASIDTLTNSDGRVCAVPSVTVTLGFAALEVLIAKELQDTCRRSIVEAHEQEHVAIWRGHLRAGASLLTPLLQRELAVTNYFADKNSAQSALHQRIEHLIGEKVSVLKSGIRSAHQQLDSPASYLFEEGRMRACP